MSLLPQEASWSEQIQECFLSFRGQGLMLSALDAEVLADWAARNVPAEVVVRGIRRAAEGLMWDARADERTLRSLRACRRFVEAEWKKHQQTSVGKNQKDVEPERTEPVHLKRHARLLEALRKLHKQGTRVEAALQRLSTANAPSSLTEAQKNEEWVYLAIFRSLPFQDRLSLLRQARELSQINVALSWSARRMSLRFHRAAVLRRQLSLPSFW